MLEILFRKILTKTEGISIPKNNSLLKKQLKICVKEDSNQFQTLDGLINKFNRFYNAELPRYGQI